MLKNYPQVTVVGSELGRPDDGTDPTGFFNDEFYVGLQTLQRSQPGARLHPHQGRTESRTSARSFLFPGVIFNFTQPAEDAVDEALTGLKSSLAVKDLRADLNVLENKGRRDQTCARPKLPASTELTVVRELGQPSLIDRCRSPQNRPLWHQRRRCRSRRSGGHRRSGGYAGHSGRKALRSGRPHGAAIPFRRPRNRQPAGAHARRPADSALRTRHNQAKHPALRLSIAKTIRATSAFSFP